MGAIMFEITMPWLLLALPLPLVIWFFFPNKKQKQTRALPIPFYDRLQNLPQMQDLAKLPFSKSQWALFFIWCLLVFAASGPVLAGKPIPLKRVGRDIMLAIDISGSMQIPDMQIDGKQASRLDAIKKIAAPFIDQREGDRIGLILFGTHAYLQTPLTYDRATVHTLLEDASIGLAGPQTAIGDAIGLAIKRLIRDPKEHRILVLLTDGVNNAGLVTDLSAAQMAAKQGVKIYTIGFGSDRAVIQSFMGPQLINPSADLDEASLKKIATLTGGRYFRAKDTKALKDVYEELNRIEPISNDQGVFHPITPLFMWPLAFGFLCSVFLFATPLFQIIKNKRAL
jgi:Ca-activated chloride channel family protein